MFGLAALLALASSATATAAAKKPNLVVILTDDQVSQLPGLCKLATPVNIYYNNCINHIVFFNHANLITLADTLSEAQASNAGEDGFDSSSA